MNTDKELILQSKATAKRIYNITPFTLLDYPDKMACILWFAGCNMRCKYCYNPDIVLGKARISYTEAIAFIHSRRHLLNAVVLSGGECTLHKGILPLIAKIKSMGLLVKIDTNGSNPPLLNKLLKSRLVDYVALDFKAPESKFHKITKSNLFGAFESSLTLLINSHIDFEVRTTVHTDLLNEEDLKNMIAFLGVKRYRGDYYIQHFVNDTATLAKLGYSVQKIDFERLSTRYIQVKVRC